MTLFQFVFLILSLAVFAVGWLRGGHPERAGVAMFVLAYAAAYVLQHLTLDAFRLGEAVVDLALTASLLWLALRHDRWWTLAAAALGGLTMAAHAVMFLTPDLQPMQVRMDIAARWGIGALMMLCIGAGVVERWMAGEAAVSAAARWRRSRSQGGLKI